MQTNESSACGDNTGTNNEASGEVGTSDDVLLVRNRVQHLREHGDHAEADVVLLDAFADKIEGAGRFRDGRRLSWTELELAQFSKASKSGRLYQLCCNRFHGGSMDPRDKTNAFIEVFKEINAI